MMNIRDDRCLIYYDIVKEACCGVFNTANANKVVAFMIVHDWPLKVITWNRKCEYWQRQEKSFFAKHKVGDIRDHVAHNRLMKH